ncbi:YkvI family membrane protein [Salibacterium aidingense]|uniref:YkvI family membrane protein n=1 Tax=Salibacterium aidingense TaxID=384933 RepID=UPI003BDF4392
MIADGLKWMFLIIGTTIGAGYASGREIWQFFGHESGLAIFIFSILFMICCYVVLKISYQEQTENYSAVLSKLMGPRFSKGYDVIIIIYLFTTTGIMVAGGGAALEYFHVPFTAGILFMAVLLFIVSIRGVKGLTSLNSVLMPVLIISLGVILFTFFWIHADIQPGNWKSQSNWTSSLTFTSLNLLPLVAVLSATGKQIKHTGEIWIASVGSGLILGGVSFLYNESLLAAAEDIMLYEIPLFALLETYPSMVTAFMAVLLWTAIFTTAASGLFGLSSRLRTIWPIPTWVLAALLLCVILPFTELGFSRLIAFLYPIYGVLNLYLLAVVIIHPFFLNKKL